MNTYLGRLTKFIFRTPVQDYINPQKYVFHHLHKCGGTSLKKSLEDFFILKKDYGVNGEPSLNFNRLKPYDLLVGHFEKEYSKLFKRYPSVEDDKVFLFTMVREPLKLKVSLYYYWMGLGWIENISLLDFLEEKPNYLSMLLYCDETNWKKMLFKYSFIGTLEDYSTSLEVLSILINRKFKIYDIENKSKKDIQYTSLFDNGLFINDFKNKNQLDYKIYNFVLERLQEDKENYLNT